MGANAEEKLAPFNYAYVPIILLLLSPGVPLAASKFVAKYNAIGAYSWTKTL